MSKMEKLSGPAQRAERTKESVRRALLELLREKDIRRIAIRELCQRAGINRTTFYNHYGSQYDVLAEIGNRYLGDIAATLENADLHDRQDIHSRVAVVFRYMEENRELSRLLLRNQADEGFAQRLFSLPKIEDMLSEALVEVESEEERLATMDFAIYGSYKLLQDWLAQEERPDAEQEAGIVLKLAGAVCRWTR